MMDLGANSSQDPNPDLSTTVGTPSCLTQCFFILPFSAVKQLKLEDGGVHTSYEVICAHIWKHVSVARQRPSYEPTYFSVLANCRPRLKPPLPSSYFGNAIRGDMTMTTTGKIFGESLHDIASRIHDIVVAIVQDSLVDFMNWAELPGNDLANPHTPKGGAILVASSPRFPVYDVDYGWGKPSAVTSPKVPGDGEVVLFGGNPKLEEGDVECCVGLSEDALKRLLDDPKFLGKAPSNPLLQIKWGDNVCSLNAAVAPTLNAAVAPTLV
ncbi:hypothetical protein L7F22_057499 [Adiantum nelumboides]|nr:hypothetical protein [Adiantum nelumboides]